MAVYSVHVRCAIFACNKKLMLGLKRHQQCLTLNRSLGDVRPVRVLNVHRYISSLTLFVFVDECKTEVDLATS